MPILPDYVISFFKFIIDKKIKINLKDSLFMIAFGGITWSLIYCFKYYQSKDVDISFYLREQSLEGEIFNNSNCSVRIVSVSFFCDNKDSIDIDYAKKIQIVIPPYQSHKRFGMSEDISNSKYINKKRDVKVKIPIPNKVVICYNFNNINNHIVNSTDNYTLRTTTKKEIKMFEKLSQK